MSLLTVTPAEGIQISENDFLAVAEKYGYRFKGNEKEEFATLLAASCNAMKFVDEMEDYQPIPDVELTPRENIYFPPKSENPDSAWAYRFDLAHKSPPSDLLKGQTLCIKDNICVAGVPCLIGTDTFTGWTPKMDATIITRILNAGGLIKGKAGYSAGGSSSGTANLVGKGKVSMGIGADPGGSIRIPAALCGLVGFKATSGSVPYTGCVSNDAVIDAVGPITTNCLDNALLLQVIAGVDGLDDRQRAGTPFPDQVPNYPQILLDTKVSGVKGLLFTELGAIVEETSVPMHEIAPAIFRAASRQDGAMGRIGKASGRRQVMLTDLFEKMLPCTATTIEKMIVVSMNTVFSSDFCWERFPHVYAKAINLPRKLSDSYNDALDKYDLLIMPTTITPADPLPKDTDSAIAKMSKTIGKLDNTCPFNSTGHPALAFPIGFVPSKADKAIQVPASMQIVGKHFDEITCLKAAFSWESSRNWKDF